MRVKKPEVPLGESSRTGLPLSMGGGHSSSTSLPLPATWLPSAALGKCLLKLSRGREDGIQADSPTELGCSGCREAAELGDPETLDAHSLGRPRAQSCAGCWDVVLDFGHQGDERSSRVFVRWLRALPGTDSRALGWQPGASCLVWCPGPWPVHLADCHPKLSHPFSVAGPANQSFRQLSVY